MIYLAIFVALLLGFLPTRIYYVKKISAIQKMSEDSLIQERSNWFDRGWEGGIAYGKYRESVDALTRPTN